MPVTLLGFRATIDKKNWEINKRKKNIRIRVEVPFYCFFLSIGSGGKFITINPISVITYQSNEQN